MLISIDSINSKLEFCQTMVYVLLPLGKPKLFLTMQRGDVLKLNS